MFVWGDGASTVKGGWQDTAKHISTCKDTCLQYKHLLCDSFVTIYYSISCRSANFHTNLSANYYLGINV